MGGRQLVMVWYVCFVLERGTRGLIVIVLYWLCTVGTVLWGVDV